jgi:3-oxoacyl-[acyl-carrier protein] reductase
MLTNKKILITGSNGGIGSSICKTFLKNNAELVLFYHKNKNKIDEIIENEQSKSNIQVHQVDLLDEKNIDDVLNEIVKDTCIDGFVHCATTKMENEHTMKLSWENFQEQLDIHTKAFFQITKKIFPGMKNNKNGKIINILTEYVIGKPPNNLSSYIVGKYSSMGLTKSLAVEFAKYGITVNSISPSMTNTPLIERLPSKLKEITKIQNPSGRLADPNDISSVALFLCSENSNYITGENIIVSGGHTMY